MLLFVCPFATGYYRLTFVANAIVFQKNAQLCKNYLSMYAFILYSISVPKRNTVVS